MEPTEGPDDDVRMRPIGHVRGGREVVEDDDWQSVTARIELDGGVVDIDATDGLDAFSHIEVVYVFDIHLQGERETVFFDV